MAISKCSNYGDGMKNKIKIQGRIKPAFSMFEIAVVLVIMTGIILLAGRIFIGNRQREYDAKCSKISASITSNIIKDLMNNTGFEFTDYIKDARSATSKEYFNNAVRNNLNIVGGGTCSNCWSKVNEITVDGKTYSDIKNNFNFYRLNDDTVIAINKTNTDILIDVNGPKRPNLAGRDICVYKYTNKTCTHLGPMPNDEFTYVQNDNCEWVKTDCNPAVRIGYNEDLEKNVNVTKTEPKFPICRYSYVCKTGNDNNTFEEGKTPTVSPEIANGCMYSYGEKVCPTDPTLLGYIEKYHNSGSRVHITPPALPDCLYKYDCDGTAVDVGKKDYSKLIADGIVREKKESATPDNNCKNTYDYECIKTVQTINYDAELHKYATGTNAGVIESTDEPTPANGCKKSYTYACNPNVKNFCVAYRAMPYYQMCGMYVSHEPDLSHDCFGEFTVNTWHIEDCWTHCCSMRRFSTQTGAQLYDCSGNQRQIIDLYSKKCKCSDK